MGSGRGPTRNCVCYWGCGNAGNQIVWVAVAIGAVLGLGLLIGGAAGGRDCINSYNDCVNAGYDRESCQEVGNQECNLSKHQGLLGSGIIILFFITPLLTCYFCCCATRPGAPGRMNTPMVMMSTQPGQQPYQQPGYGGYPAPPPGYSQYSPPGGEYPTNAYPPMAYPGAYPAYPAYAQPPGGPGAGTSQPSVVAGVPYFPPPQKQV